ncbi:MAG: hypothetical protein NT025_07970 [bacterium]|nr:hypothetical protein [bacterium]
MRLSTTSLIMLSLCVAAFAQPRAPEIEWSRTYGGSGDDECSSVQPTADGGYVLAGATNSFGAGDYDAWLLKTDADGDSLWSRTYGGIGNDYCAAAYQTADGGYVLCGGTDSYGAGSHDFWLVRTTAGGDSLWSRTFGGAGWDICYGMQQTADGGFVLAGSTTSLAGQSDFWLVRTNENGDSLWSRTFGGLDGEECLAMINTLDDGYLLAGWTGSFGDEQDFWAVKTNASGDSIWSQVYGEPASDACCSADQAPEGGFVLAGWTWSSESGDDFWLIRTDSSGSSLWTRRFGGSDWDVCQSVIQTSDGYALGGYTFSFGAGDCDAWLVKVDLDGDSVWSLTVGGDSTDDCRAVLRSSDGGYVLAGYTNSFGAGDYNFWLVKTGPELFSTNPPPPQNIRLLTNYPNPFNARTTVEFTVPRSSRVMIRAYDLLGREVGTISDDFYAPGRHTIPWECRNCASGTYWITMSRDGFQLVRKTILLR